MRHPAEIWNLKISHKFGDSILTGHLDTTLEWNLCLQALILDCFYWRFTETYVLFEAVVPFWNSEVEQNTLQCATVCPKTRRILHTRTANTIIGMSWVATFAHVATSKTTRIAKSTELIAFNVELCACFNACLYSKSCVCIVFRESKRMTQHHKFLHSVVSVFRKCYKHEGCCRKCECAKRAQTYNIHFVL